MSKANQPNPSHHQPEDYDRGYLSEDTAQQMPIREGLEHLPPAAGNIPSRERSLSASERIDPRKLSGNGKTDSSSEDCTKNIDWHALAHKLRERNRELVKTVVQLEQALTDSQEKLQSQILRTRSGDTLISQQTEELNTSQEQIGHLCHELETARQTAQHQEILLETLSKQLEASQEQVAQLERECALLQEDSEQQAEKLSEAEQQVQELLSRLSRQQRYTLQFKAALDRCLEVPSPNNAIRQQLERATAIASAIPKAKPIQPWSAQLKEDFENSSELDRSSSSQSYVVETIDSFAAELPIDSQIQAQEDYPVNYPVKEIVLPNLDGSKSTSGSREKPENNTHRDREIIDTQSNSPSPAIKPIPDEKKRKSNVEIDLPKFVRHHSS